MSEATIIQPKIEDVFGVVRGIKPTASMQNFKGMTKSVRVDFDGGRYSFDLFLDHGGETLTFYGEVGFPYAGFATFAGSWNNHEVIGPLITLVDGYALKFDVNISHGAMKATLEDVIKAFYDAFGKLVAHRQDKQKET